MGNRLRCCVVFVLILTVLSLSGCRVRQSSIAESDKHFTASSMELFDTAQLHGVAIVDETDDFALDYGNAQLYRMANRDLCYDFDNGMISIYLQNSAYLDADGAVTTSDTGQEIFSIYYTLWSDDNFDLELFTDLVNTVSDYTLTVEECEEFLSAPADEYPPLWQDSDVYYDVEKFKNYTALSDIRLTFDRGLCYHENSGERELEFFGLCRDVTDSYQSNKESPSRDGNTGRAL